MIISSCFYGLMMLLTGTVLVVTGIILYSKMRDFLEGVRFSITAIIQSIKNIKSPVFVYAHAVSMVLFFGLLFGRLQVGDSSQYKINNYLTYKKCSSHENKKIASCFLNPINKKV